MSSEAAFIRLEHISKYFENVVANDLVSLEIHQGEILGLLGENGAGKTTLMNILYGLYRQDHGTIYLDGSPVQMGSPKDAIDLGIGMVHQHFMLVPRHTVIENMVLGKPGQKGLLKLRKAASEVNELTKRFGFDIPLNSVVRDLSVGVQQKLEILKAIYRGAKLLIMDEPTAVLTPHETDELFVILRNFAKEGHTVVLITHKLNEVIAITDRVAVLRDGRNVGEVSTAETNTQELSRLMVDRDIEFEPARKRTPEFADVAVRVRDVSAIGSQGNTVIRNISFDIRRGEIFGIAGVTGNGQEPLANVATGLLPIASGSIHLNGRDITREDAAASIRNGVAYIPADRQRTALILEMSVKDNLLLKSYNRPPFARAGVLNEEAGTAQGEALISDYKIKASSPESLVRTLSGGHQQRVVVARELSLDPDLIVAFQPTRGLDVGAIEYVHNVLSDARAKGKSILLISTELSELFALSDRIGVLYGGELLASFPIEEATVERVGSLMAGVRENA